MTQDERNMLADLANRIAQTPTPPKDADAEEFIRKNIGSRPDALYLMTQTVLIQNMALQQSQHQIQELQQRVSQPVQPSGGSGSFLGGGGSAPPPQYSQGQYSQSQYSGAPQYQPAQQYAAAPLAAAPTGAPSAMSGFLRNAAQTAAGVAAGTLAVQGIESLFSHHGGYGGGSGFFGGGGIGGYGGGGETIIENNYYDDPHSGQGERLSDSGNMADVGLNDLDRDSLDQNADNTQDASYDDSNALGDDSNYDDSSGSDDNQA